MLAEYRANTCAACNLVGITTKVCVRYSRRSATHLTAHIRRAAALADSLAETLPRDAAPLMAEVRALVQAQPRGQLADRYLVQLRRPDPAGPGSSLALTQPAHSSGGAADRRGAMNSGVSGSADAAAGHAAAAATAPQATGKSGMFGRSSIHSQLEMPVSTASEIQPCAWATNSPAGCGSTAAAAEAWDTESSPPSARWPQPDAAREQMLQAAAINDDDDAACAKLTHWQPDVEFFLHNGPPRQSWLTLCFADWRLEQLFQPWRAAACSQVHRLVGHKLMVVRPPSEVEGPV